MSNEQRAHDLAITVVSSLNIPSIDFYVEYKRIYFELLESFNRDFPHE